MRDVFRVVLRTHSGYSPEHRRCCDVETEFMLCNAGKLQPPGKPCHGSCGLWPQKTLFDREPIRVSLWRTKRHGNAPQVSEEYEGEDWETSDHVMLFCKSRALERKFLLQPSKQSILSLSLPPPPPHGPSGVISINAVRRLRPLHLLLFLCHFQRDNCLKTYGSYICISYCNIMRRCV